MRTLRLDRIPSCCLPIFITPRDLPHSALLVAVSLTLSMSRIVRVSTSFSLPGNLVDYGVIQPSVLLVY